MPVFQDHIARVTDEKVASDAFRPYLDVAKMMYAMCGEGFLDENGSTYLQLFETYQARLNSVKSSTHALRAHLSRGSLDSSVNSVVSDVYAYHSELLSLLIRGMKTLDQAVDGDEGAVRNLMRARRGE